MKRKWLFPWALGALAALAGARVHRRFRKDLSAAWERIEAGGRVVQTARGEIEYGEAGDGFPILLIHGAGGGYDHALLAGQFILNDGYRMIAASRFGYLRSPPVPDPSPRTQADLLASLLDTLDVERVAVAAFSAGGPTGVQFALNYPRRTSALVLVSGISCVPGPEGKPWQERSEARRLLASEFVYWLGLRVARRRLLSHFGISKAIRAAWSTTEREQANQILEAMLPLNARLAGYALDRALVVSCDVPLESIRCPTLVIHARDDTVVDLENGQRAADRIPGAESMFFEHGGHLLLGQHATVRTGVTGFLDRALNQR